jgi:beta-lactamase class A
MDDPEPVDVDEILAPVPGVASVWCATATGRIAFARDADAVHRAASTLKVAVLAALYRAVDGGLDPDQTLIVRNEFVSAAPGAPTYGCARRDDSDDEVWQRLGSPVRLSWLADRMIVRSSNLATNLLLAQLGLPAVASVLRAAGARRMAVVRGLEDDAAIAAGLANVVTAADLGALFGALLAGTLASAPGCAAMLETLTRTEFRADLPAGLPPGTRVAFKNGWLSGVRHSAGVIFPDDAPPFVLAVCLTTPWAVRHGDAACQVVARVAAAAWAARHRLTPAGSPAAPPPSRP